MAPEFRNEPIDVSSLPQIDEQGFTSLHPAYLRVSLLGRGVAAAIVAVAGAVVALSIDDGWWIPLVVAGGVLVLIGLAAVLRVFEVNKMGYLIRQHDISYRSGIINLATATVPFVRVQHASLHQGPIERRFGLATVNVNSAGSDLSIPGVAKDDADRIAGLIVERAGELLDDDPTNDVGPPSSPPVDDLGP